MGSVNNGPKVEPQYNKPNTATPSGGIPPSGGITPEQSIRLSSTTPGSASPSGGGSSLQNGPNGQSFQPSNTLLLVGSNTPVGGSTLPGGNTPISLKNNQFIGTLSTPGGVTPGGVTGLQANDDNPIKKAIRLGREQQLRDAANSGDMFAVLMLAKHGVDVTAADQNGHTALMNAAFHQDPEMLQLLLSLVPPDKKVAFLNAQDTDPPAGYTAFHNALSVNGPVNADVLKILLAAGADPHIKNSRGETPEDIAISRGHPENADVLRKILGDMYGAANG